VYTDLNLGGVLFQAFAAVFVSVTGILFVLSRQVRARLARIHSLVHNRKNDGLAIPNEKAKN
jgi:hypothetical protein